MSGVFQRKVLKFADLNCLAEDMRHGYHGRGREFTKEEMHL
jgi:hypothetical protein